MKFLSNLTEALRNIPKDLPGKDKWGPSVRWHFMAVASTHGDSLEDINRFEDELEEVLDEHIPGGCGGFEGIDTIKPSDIQSYSEDYGPDFAEWVRKRQEEGKNVHTFNLAQPGDDDTDISTSFEYGNLDIIIL